MRSAAWWMREEIGGSNGIFQCGKTTRGWRAKCCRVVQRKVTGEKKGGCRRPVLGDERARGQEGESSISGWENGRGFGQRRFVSGARRGWRGLARGRWERRPRGLPAPTAAFFSRFCKRNSKYFFPSLQLAAHPLKRRSRFPCNLSAWEEKRVALCACSTAFP